MIDSTDEDKASLDSFSFRSILNIDPGENSAKATSGQIGQTSQPKKSPLSIITQSPGNRPKSSSTDQVNSPNLNSFYLANDYEADDEDHFHNHFKSIHLPSQSESNGLNLNQKDSLPNNGIELDSVKHKLSSLWNNVKYGWSNYLKKPNKIDLDKNELIVILGKKFNQPTVYEQTSNGAGSMNKYGNSSFYFYNDASDKMPDVDNNYSFISPVEYESHSKAMPNNSRNKSKLNTIDNNNSPTHNNSNEDYLTMTYSYLSTSSIFSNILSKSLSTESITNDSLKKLPKLTNDNMKTPLEQEIYSRLWFTYRKDFSPLFGNNNVKYTSDCGWGCMLRTGQMLIAQGLLHHLFGPDWSLYTSLQSDQDISVYRELISLFNDRQSSQCPFGIHNLLEIADKKSIDEGEKRTSRVGTWFGPTSVCLLVRDALNGALLSSKNKLTVLESVRIYVAQDCTVFKQDVLDLCTDFGRCEFKPCILLISARLGGESINEIYVDSLKMFFQMQNCIGMIGGRPKHSLYFIGYQNEKVIYLDPHICQPATNVYPTTSDKSSPPLPQMQTSFDETTFNSFQSSELFDNSSFHCSSPSKISFSKLDPSIAIGFYCKSLDEFNEFCRTIKKSSNSDIYPIFGICDDTFEKTQLNYELFSIHDKHSSPASPVSPTVTTNASSHLLDIGSKLPTSKKSVMKNAAQNEFTSRSNKHAKTSGPNENLKSSSKNSKGTSRSSSFSKSGSLGALNKNRKTSNKKIDVDEFVFV